MNTNRAPLIIAALLMVGFFVWILAQMAPHGPKDGEMLIRLTIGMGLVLVALVLGGMRFSRHRRKSR